MAVPYIQREIQHQEKSLVVLTVQREVKGTDKFEIQPFIQRIEQYIDKNTNPIPPSLQKEVKNIDIFYINHI